jgi:gamma-glutamyltranspeptidase/glutathione hydrolase
MDKADLAGYRAIEREPRCVKWRQRWPVCGHPPPSLGGVAVAQLLGLEQARAETLPRAADEPKRLHRSAELSRLAFADRARQRWARCGKPSP